jgi:hypothetical protein
MKLTAMLVAVSFLAGCATSYQPQSFSGGFSEVMRGDDVYLVRFHGNGYTSPERAEDMTLLRAAELTLQKGRRYFTILSEDTRMDQSTYTTPTQSTTTGSINQFGSFNARTTNSGGQTFDIRRPSARLLVGMSATNDIPGRIWIDAQRVLSELGPRYK